MSILDKQMDVYYNENSGIPLMQKFHDFFSYETIYAPLLFVIIVIIKLLHFPWPEWGVKIASIEFVLKCHTKKIRKTSQRRADCSEKWTPPLSRLLQCMWVQAVTTHTR